MICRLDEKPSLFEFVDLGLSKQFIALSRLPIDGHSLLFHLASPPRTFVCLEIQGLWPSMVDFITFLLHHGGRRGPCDVGPRGTSSCGGLGRRRPRRRRSWHWRRPRRSRRSHSARPCTSAWIFVRGGVSAAFSSQLHFSYFFCHPGCSAFCVHHPHMAPFGRRGPLTHHCDLEAGYGGKGGTHCGAMYRLMR